MNEGPVTKGRRFFKLAGMTAQVAGSYAKTRIKGLFQSEEDAERERNAAHELNGGRIARTLGELKGAVMKVGQMASIASDLLPKELAEALRSLQRQAPPVDFAVIARQIESELGAAPEVLFKRFEVEPFAAASIGQVHRATTDDGREVVVKVQYPGVDGAVDSDLAQLKFALKAGGFVKRATGLVDVKQQSLDEVFAEIRARLVEELDYCNEADNVRRFGEIHRGDAHIIVPEVVGERSSQRVLTLTFEPGDRIDELDARGYPQEVRDRIGDNLFRALAAQLFEHRILHADPNPGNLAFRPNGEIVLYDFGCVKQVRPEIAAAYAKTIRRGIAEDWDGVDEALRELGVRNPEGPPVEPAFYKQWRDTLALPFLTGEPFDYARATLHEDVIRLIPAAIKRMASFQPPREIIFIDRAIAGHYGNLRRVRARSRVLDMVQPYLDVALANAPE
ncbi:AarF/ABC1/UbiB kinase family protein [Nannocystis pusilla]|uniref:AarF/ABC1/UbiB kinase family protein n=1 Tax=Nannocystis pusilla TaxID=889268 RepID=A0A9X3EXD5_9BACT|nr:AarF/ABC1/UbiB kinase family protein [Nannocystis pusilla]MCY1011304.1 AarF/ABC1/UbiB kinase family protein [Nannocystis pusilla]